MSKVLVTESNLQDIADAIRSKNQGSDTYRPGDMAAAILAIPTGSGSTLVSKTITQNGEYDPEDDNADGYSSVTVNVESSESPDGYTFSDGVLHIWEVADSATLGTKSITSNGNYSASDDNVDGYSDVTVNVQGGGGTSPVVNRLDVSSNGSYTPPSGVDGYSPVVVNVSNTYASTDEGKVVSNGALVAQSTRNVTANGTYDTTENDEVVVNVPSAILKAKTITTNGNYNPSSDSADGYSSVTVNVPNSYGASDEGKVVSSGQLVAQSTRNVTANGTYDTTENDEVVVNVPNTYAAADEGKVISNGALVAQTSMTVTQNGRYNTTEKNSILVNVSSTGFENTETFAIFRVVESGHEYILVQRTGTNGLTSVTTFTDIQFVSNTPVMLVVGDLLSVDAYHDTETGYTNIRIYSENYSGTYEETRLTSSGFSTRTGSYNRDVFVYGDPKVIYFKLTRSVS